VYFFAITEAGPRPHDEGQQSTSGDSRPATPVPGKKVMKMMALIFHLIAR